MFFLAESFLHHSYLVSQFVVLEFIPFHLSSHFFFIFFFENPELVVFFCFLLFKHFVGFIQLKPQIIYQIFLILFSIIKRTLSCREQIFVSGVFILQLHVLLSKVVSLITFPLQVFVQSSNLVSHILVLIHKSSKLLLGTFNLYLIFFCQFLVLNTLFF